MTLGTGAMGVTNKDSREWSRFTSWTRAAAKNCVIGGKKRGRSKPQQ